jgi:hypothetical protein
VGGKRIANARIDLLKAQPECARVYLLLMKFEAQPLSDRVQRPDNIDNDARAVL